MRRAWCGAAVLLAAALAGCGPDPVPGPIVTTTLTDTDPATPTDFGPTTSSVTPDDPAGTFAPPPGTATRPAPAAPPAASTTGAPYTPQEFYSDYYTAVQVVDQYWTAHWSEHFTGSYKAPLMWTGNRFPNGMYQGGVDRIACGSEYLQANNAYYCRPTDYVAFDIDFLWRARYNGDMFVYMIVAHEWGHAIQDQLRSELNLVASELQADCFAGAALQGAATDGTLLIESGDLEEVDVGLTDVADRSPWGKPTDHGAPQERISSFNHGVQQGASGCLPRS